MVLYDDLETLLVHMNMLWDVHLTSLPTPTNYHYSTELTENEINFIKYVKTAQMYRTGLEIKVTIYNELNPDTPIAHVGPGGSFRKHERLDEVTNSYIKELNDCIHRAQILRDAKRASGTYYVRRKLNKPTLRDTDEKVEPDNHSLQ